MDAMSRWPYDKGIMCNFAAIVVMAVAGGEDENLLSIFAFIKNVLPESCRCQYYLPLHYAGWLKP